jgi:hypothetical protein
MFINKELLVIHLKLFNMIRQAKHKKPNTEIYKDEQHEPHENPGMNPCAHEWKVVPASMIQPLSSINLGFIIK